MGVGAQLPFSMWFFDLVGICLLLLLLLLISCFLDDDNHFFIIFHCFHFSLSLLMHLMAIRYASFELEFERDKRRGRAAYTPEQRENIYNIITQHDWQCKAPWPLLHGVRGRKEGWGAGLG